MRYIFLLTAFLWSAPVASVDWEDRRLFEGQVGVRTLRVISSTDTSVFAPIIDIFLLANPRLNIEYLVAGSAAIYEEFRQSPGQYDLVISSAMDLQFKLVNDGYAYRVPDIAHPDWAQWRQSLFGFTLESASIVVNKEAFTTLAKPRSRRQMIEALRTNPEFFRGKIGTYDVRQSGLGYLFATQDSRASETYWRLMEVMGSLDTRLYCCSGEMIEDLAAGKIVISYNVLGSYAKARGDIESEIEVILPNDFPNTMMRTALVAQSTDHLAAATRFLRFLTSSGWSDDEKGDASLPPLSIGTDEVPTSTIALGPGLMIFLDRLKRQAFIKEWENAVIQ